MPKTPRINWILFGLFALLTAVVLLAALIWPSVRAIAYAPLRDLVWPTFFLPTKAGIQATIQVAVPAALEGWMQEIAADFDQQQPRIQVQVIQMRGVDAVRKLNAAVGGLPDVWVAEAGFVRTNVGGIPYQPGGLSIATDSLVWVTVSSASDPGRTLDWQAVYDAARGDLQFRIALPPVNSVEGMAACMSAAAAYHQQENLTADLVNDPAFQRWLDELLEAAPNRSRNPRDQLGSRPPEVNVGLILSSQWHHLPQQGFLYQPPRYNVRFDYPYLIRSNWYELPPEQADARRAAAEKFRDFVLDSAAQSKLQQYGLQPANAQLVGQLVQVNEPAIRASLVCWQ